MAGKSYLIRRENMAVSLEPMVKVSDELKEMLNKAIAREIQVSVQYMWQHVQVWE